MAYENLEIIKVYNGTRDTFLTNGSVPASYYDKLVLVTGGVDLGTSTAVDPYLFAVDASGNYREIDIPKQWVHGIKINGDKSTLYTDGSIDLRTVADKGVALTFDSTNKAIVIDASSLHGLATTASSNANNAGMTAQAALELAQQNKKDIAALTGDDSGGTITDIAAEAVEELRKQIYGDDHEELEAYETIPELRTDIDAISHTYQVGVTGADGVYTIKQGNVTVGTITIPKDMVVSSGSVVKGNWSGDEFTESTSGTGHAIKLIIANSNDVLYINVAGLVDTYTGEASNDITVSISDYKVSATLKTDSIGASHLKNNAVTTAKIADKNVTKAKLEEGVQTSLGLADSSVQAVRSLDTTLLSFETKKTNNMMTSTATVKTNTMGNALLADGAVEGLATVDDVYAFLKARLSVKVQ